MSEQNDERHDELDGWPMPSREVLRDLDRPAVSWPAPDAEASPVPARAA